MTCIHFKSQHLSCVGALRCRRGKGGWCNYKLKVILSPPPPPRWLWINSLLKFLSSLAPPSSPAASCLWPCLWREAEPHGSSDHRCDDAGQTAPFPVTTPCTSTTIYCMDLLFCFFGWMSVCVSERESLLRQTVRGIWNRWRTWKSMLGLPASTGAERFKFKPSPELPYFSWMTNSGTFGSEVTPDQGTLRGKRRQTHWLCCWASIRLRV